VRVHRFAAASDLHYAAAAWLGQAAGAAGRFVALAVGDSTLPVYRHLGPLATGQVVLTLDELAPPPAQEGARFSVRLTAALPPAWRGAVRPFTLAEWGLGDLEALAGAVESAVAAEGLAVALCGVGPDGHVAFNQPPSDGGSRTRVVDLAAANLSRLGEVAPARSAFTLGLGTLRKAARLGVVVAGEGKAASLRRLLDGPAGADCPVTWLRGHPGLEVFVLET
jgi:glucosamine-6-phosphate deaminase